MFDELIKRDKTSAMAHIGSLTELKDIFREMVNEGDIGRKNRLRYRFMGLYGRLSMSNRRLASLAVIDNVDSNIGLLVSELECSIKYT